MEAISNAVVVVGGVRSGTTVFRQFLATHARLADCGEIFNSGSPGGFYPFLADLCCADKNAILPENLDRAFEQYLEALCARVGGKRPIIDIKYEHLPLLHRPWDMPFGMPPLLEFLRKHRLSVIHLRRNPVDAVISNLVAKQRKIFHIRASQQSASELDEPLTIDPQILQKQLRRRIRTARVVSRFFRASKRYLQLDYEELFDQGAISRTVSDRVAGALSISAEFDHQPKLRKTTEGPRHTIIRNLAELEPTIAKYDNYFASV